MTHGAERDYEHEVSWWKTSEAASGAPGGGGDPWGAASGGDAFVQRRADGGASAGLGAHELVPSGGCALDPMVQRKMERALGADFRDVRVHLDDARARAMNAEAYTVGTDIVLGSGNQDLRSSAGQHTLAHELTHVVQQRSGPVAGTSFGGGVSVSDPSDSFERAAEDAADRAMGGAPVGPAAPAPAGGGSSGGGVSVQCKGGGGAGALKDMYDNAKGLYDVLKHPAGSVERRDAAMDQLREKLGAVPIVGDKIADGLQSWKNKEEAKLGTVTEGEGMTVEGELNGDNATINKNLQGENVGDIDTGNGQIVKPDGTIVDKSSGAVVPDTQPDAAKDQQDAQ
jgi:hypothetical protein